jgi:hypothetical protein
MVRAFLAAGVAASLLLLASAAGAQQPPTQSPAQPQGQPPTAEGMGVSLKNIRRQAAPVATPERKSGDPFHYDFVVEVIGKKPPYDFFKDFDLSKGGAVRYGGVTHQEILNAVTPFPFHIYGGIDVMPKKSK